MIDLSGARRVAGGDLNEAYRVELPGGRAAFVKRRDGAPPEEYATEAAGLEWLRSAGALRVPEVVEVGVGFLALEWVEAGRRTAAGEEELGRGLAALHRAGAPAFGAPPAQGLGPNRPHVDVHDSAQAMRLGPLVLPSDACASWAEFYATRRLLPLAKHADEPRVIERVAERLPDLVGPEEPPSRLHGDLWSGNVLWDAGGRPWLIDPAAYGGHREVDLAMLSLFGDPGARFRAAYAEAAPLASGHPERTELYQLFPLLVHAALFGGGYAVAASRAARRYV